MVEGYKAIIDKFHRLWSIGFNRFRDHSGTSCRGFPIVNKVLSKFFDLISDNVSF